MLATSPLNLSSATWRLETVSLASKHENTHVLLTELGLCVLTI